MNEGGRTATLVSKGTTINGKIEGASEVIVEGAVEGEIILDSTLVIAAEGKVTGDVRAASVRIGGRLQGNVQAVDRVELLTSGSIEGDVTAPRVAIAEGAFCKGRIEMNPDKASKASTSVAASASDAAGSPAGRS